MIWKFAGHNDALKRLAALINVSSHKILSTANNSVDEKEQDRMSARMENKKHPAPGKHRIRVKFSLALHEL